VKLASDQFADLLETSLINIIVPNNIKNLSIGYCFKQDGLKSANDGKKKLLKKSLDHLQLKIRTIEELSEVYIIRISDPVKLKRNESQRQETQGNLSISEDKKLISIHNMQITELINQLENLLDANVMLQFDNNKLHDITLSLKDFKGIKTNSYWGWPGWPNGTKVLVLIPNFSA
jgi:hypothetical protein